MNRLCQHCGRLIPERTPTGRWTRRDRRYCTAACQEAAYREREREAADKT